MISAVPSSSVRLDVERPQLATFVSRCWATAINSSSLKSSYMFSVYASERSIGLL